jgi:hypothetical protein
LGRLKSSSPERSAALAGRACQVCNKAMLVELWGRIEKSKLRLQGERRWQANPQLE